MASDGRPVLSRLPDRAFCALGYVSLQETIYSIWKGAPLYYAKRLPYQPIPAGVFIHFLLYRSTHRGTT
jgi:hypothetical protein